MNRKLFIILIVCLLILPLKVRADIGPKPSIDVKVDNLKTSNYLIDLFVYDKDGKDYSSEKSYNGEGLTEEQITKLYELNYEGWISESTRWSSYLLFADCAGNKDHTHHFSYFGTPTKYKVVIINNDTGEIKISDEIVRKDFNSSITIDYKTMDTISKKSNNSILMSLIALILTIIVEVLIAHLFKTGYYKIITITNIITNLCLQIFLLLMANKLLLAFIIGEVIVIVCELLIYLYRFKDLSKFKIALYTLCANIVTIIISILTLK